MLMAGFKRWRQLAAGAQQQLLGLGLAFGSYALFFLFWVPFNVEFWLPQLLLLWWGWLKLGEQRAKRWFPALLAGMLLALGGINYVGTVHWLRQPARDYYRARTQAWAAHTQAGDLVILCQRWVHAAYAEAFLPAEARSLIDFCPGPMPDTAALGQALSQTLAQQGRVLIDPKAWQPEQQHPELTPAQAEAFVRYLHRWRPAGRLISTPFGPTLFLSPAPNNPGPD
jgi:type II secretory pathway component PulM